MSVAAERLFELASDAASHLDGSWRFNRLGSDASDSYWRTEALLSDDNCPGRAVVLRACWRNHERVRITGRYPTGVRASGPAITVNPKRTARAIAGDINRRFLPDYLASWRESTATQQAQALRDEAFLQKLSLMRRFAPELRPANGSDLNSDRFYFDASQSTSTLTLYKVASDDRASLELRLPFEDVLRVIALLRPIE